MTPIWIYWEQGWDKAPGPIQECAASWERSNPEYKLCRLSSENIESFVEFDDTFLKLTRNMRVQTKSDLFRLMLLKQHGGIWVDATLYCARPLNTWLTLSAEQPVALFHNPGPDRLVSSWFIAAKPDNELIGIWLSEMLNFLETLPNPGSPSGLRKLVQKLLQQLWSTSPEKTLNWWRLLPHRILSITPYYCLHYCYNRLALTDADFRNLSLSTQKLAAEPAHKFQFALAAKGNTRKPVNLAGIPVHKLNWRKLPSDRSIKALLAEIGTQNA